MVEATDSRGVFSHLAEFYPALRRIPVLASGGAPVSFDALMRSSGDLAEAPLDVDRFAGVLSFLHALGAVHIVPNAEAPHDFGVAYASDRAFDFVICTALCSKQGIPALNTWQLAYRPDEPPWGIPMVREMEKRRLAPPTDPNAVEVVRQEEVVAILIKSRRRRGFRTQEVYLCQRDEHSGIYNFIGGKKRRQESHRETAERKLFEELGLSVGTYKVEPLTMETVAPPLETRKISNETGVYTKYTFLLYHAMHITGQAGRRQTNRWFTEQELLAGQGSRKERIMTHEEVIGALRSRINAERYPGGLADVDVSIRSSSDLRATPRRDVIEWLVDNRELVAVLAALASLIYTVLKILGVI